MTSSNDGADGDDISATRPDDGSSDEVPAVSNAGRSIPGEELPETGIPKPAPETDVRGRVRTRVTLWLALGEDREELKAEWPTVKDAIVSLERLPDRDAETRGTRPAWLAIWRRGSDSGQLVVETDPAGVLLSVLPKPPGASEMALLSVPEPRDLDSVLRQTRAVSGDQRLAVQWRADGQHAVWIESRTAQTPEHGEAGAPDPALLAEVAARNKTREQLVHWLHTGGGEDNFSDELGEWIWPCHAGARVDLELVNSGATWARYKATWTASGAVGGQLIVETRADGTLQSVMPATANLQEISATPAKENLRNVLTGLRKSQPNLRFVVEWRAGDSYAIWVDRARRASPPIEPKLITTWCPRCSRQHFDLGVWRHRPHKTHLCAGCGAEWTPEDYETYGVSRFEIDAHGPPAGEKADALWTGAYQAKDVTKGAFWRSPSGAHAFFVAGHMVAPSMADLIGRQVVLVQLAWQPGRVITRTLKEFLTAADIRKLPAEQIEKVEYSPEMDALVAAALRAGPAASYPSVNPAQLASEAHAFLREARAQLRADLGWPAIDLSEAAAVETAASESIFALPEAMTAPKEAGGKMSPAEVKELAARFEGESSAGRGLGRLRCACGSWLFCQEGDGRLEPWLRAHRDHVEEPAARNQQHPEPPVPWADLELPRVGETWTINLGDLDPPVPEWPNRVVLVTIASVDLVNGQGDKTIDGRQSRVTVRPGAHPSSFKLASFLAHAKRSRPPMQWPGYDAGPAMQPLTVAEMAALRSEREALVAGTRKSVDADPASASDVAGRVQDHEQAKEEKQREDDVLPRLGDREEGHDAGQEAEDDQPDDDVDQQHDASYTPERDLDEAVARALAEPDLVSTLVSIAVWEMEQIMELEGGAIPSEKTREERESYFGGTFRRLLGAMSNSTVTVQIGRLDPGTLFVEPISGDLGVVLPLDNHRRSLHPGEAETMKLASGGRWDLADETKVRRVNVLDLVTAGSGGPRYERRVAPVWVVPKGPNPQVTIAETPVSTARYQAAVGARVQVMDASRADCWRFGRIEKQAADGDWHVRLEGAWTGIEGDGNGNDVLLGRRQFSAVGDLRPDAADRFDAAEARAGLNTIGSAADILRRRLGSPAAREFGEIAQNVRRVTVEVSRAERELQSQAKDSSMAIEEAQRATKLVAEHFGRVMDQIGKALGVPVVPSYSDDQKALVAQQKAGLLVRWLAQIADACRLDDTTASDVTTDRILDRIKWLSTPVRGAEVVGSARSSRAFKVGDRVKRDDGGARRGRIERIPLSNGQFDLVEVEWDEGSERGIDRRREVVPACDLEHDDAAVSQVEPGRELIERSLELLDRRLTALEAKKLAEALSSDSSPSGPHDVQVGDHRENAAMPPEPQIEEWHLLKNGEVIAEGDECAPGAGEMWTPARAYQVGRQVGRAVNLNGKPLIVRRRGRGSASSVPRGRPEWRKLKLTDVVEAGDEYRALGAGSDWRPVPGQWAGTTIENVIGNGAPIIARRRERGSAAARAVLTAVAGKWYGLKVDDVIEDGDEFTCEADRSVNGSGDWRSAAMFVGKTVKQMIDSDGVPALVRRRCIEAAEPGEWR